MEDGLENDDRYRMVEDEFLTVAQQFTVHLHAAEYKRQQKQVKARNVDAIRSISRPVTSKMPDQTRRKAEANERSMVQRSALEDLRRKNPGSLESSDEEDLPYVGTTLHNFMDSPRKKAVSLLGAGSIAKTTRAAAGFGKRSNAQIKSPSKSQGSINWRTGSVTPIQGSETESDTDDDLDGPMPALKMFIPNSAPLLKGESLSNSRPISNVSRPTTVATRPQSAILGDTKMVDSSTRLHSAGIDEARKTQIVSSKGKPHALSDTLPTDNSVQSKSTISRTSRLDNAQKQKMQRMAKDQKEKELDVIPAFL